MAAEGALRQTPAIIGSVTGLPARTGQYCCDMDTQYCCDMDTRQDASTVAHARITGRGSASRFPPRPTALEENYGTWLLCSLV